MNSVTLQGKKLIYRNVLHFYTLITIRKRIKKIIPFTITSKRIKYLGINLPKEVKGLYLKNYKTQMKEMEDDTDGKIYCIHRLEGLILLK